MLWLAAGLAFLLEGATPGQGMARPGYVLMIVILISGLFSFCRELRVERTLAALRRLLPHRVQVLREGQVLDLDSEELVPGDVILLEQGDSVPADCRLIEAYAVRVNNASVTGESLPQPWDTPPSVQETLVQGTIILLSDTSVAAGRGRAVVFATGMRPKFGRIAQLTQMGGEAVSPLRREIAHLSRLIILLALAIGGVFFALGWLIGFPLWQDFVFAVGLVAAMVPEGLLPTLTLSLVLATQRMARRNVLIRHLPAVEALDSATVICTDKTGTLTVNRMTVESVLPGAADHPRTALAIAEEIGPARTPEARAISGDVLCRLSDTQLQPALDEAEVLFSRVAADQKTRIVDALKRKGHIMAVTGDGANDAPALKSAHIGVAMGRGGTDMAKEAALVLPDDNFACIVSGIEEGRAGFDNIRKFLTYMLAHNVPELAPYSAFALFSLPFAVKPMQMLAVDMGTASLTALEPGVERPEQDIMRRPLPPPRERLMDWRLAVRAHLSLGLLEAVAVMKVFLVVLHAPGWHYGQPLGPPDPLCLYATAACLGSIVLLQVSDLFLCRSPSRSVRHTGMLGNPLILAGVAVEFGSILLIACAPVGNAFFGSARVQFGDWLWVAPFAGALLVLEETHKWGVRRASSPKAVDTPAVGHRRGREKGWR